MATGISFAGNNLQTANILTAEIDHLSYLKDLKFFALSHANRSKIPYSGYPSRIVKMSGKILPSTAGDIAGTDTLVDTFKSYFVGTDQSLDVDYAGTTRRYLATVNTISVARPGNLAFANFDIEFVCTDPFGRDTSATTALTATGRTAASYSDAYTFLGTAPYQVPIASITLTAVTGGTNQSMTWGNAANGQGITVQRTWTAGDLLVIDCLQKIVTLNGTEVAFSGAFPEFPPGAQTMQYTDTFTTRTFNISVAYTKGYL